MTVVQEILLRLDTDYRGHPYYVSGNALYQALARRVDERTRRALHVSHGVLLPGEWGRAPAWHPREGSIGKVSTGLRDVESYADLVVYRDAAHRWLLDDRPRDAHNALPVRTHGGRLAVAPQQHFGRPPGQRNDKRTVEWFVHVFLHAAGDTAPAPADASVDADRDTAGEPVVPLAEKTLDGLRVGGARNYGFGATSLVDSQVIDLDELDYGWLRGADAHTLELVTPYVLTSDYPGADDQSVPWWWTLPDDTADDDPAAAPGTAGRADLSVGNGDSNGDDAASGGLRRRPEQLVADGDVYELGTVDHGQVLGYAGDRPIETARNGILRVGTHSRFGFGELRVRPAGTDRVAARAASDADGTRPSGVRE